MKNHQKNRKMKSLNGTWLMVKTGDDYGPPEFIEFKNDQIIHFDLEKKSGDKLVKKTSEWNEKLIESKYEFINDNRIRIYRMGKTHTVISEAESKIEDTEYGIDYERITPTETELTANKIQKLEFKAEWNNEKIPFVFNTELDSKSIKEINNELNREGQKLVLENLQGTYFASVYDNGKRRTLIGIKEITEEKAILYGFPEIPYQIIAK